MPNSFIIGKNMGVNINIAGVMSIKQPIIRSIMFININIITLLWDNANIEEATVLGKFEYAKAQDIKDEHAIKNNTIDDNIIVSLIISKNPFKVNDLYIIASIIL